MQVHTQPQQNTQRLKELVRLFLKLGIVGFGGPAVHIAMMEEEVVRKRKWFTHEHFLDMVGATNLIPGPNSTEMTMHIGYERAGRTGLIVAGLCFILPAVIITAVFAWAYKQYGQLPEVAPFIYGVKPAILAVIFSLCISLGRKAMKNVTLGVLGAIAFVLALLGVNEIYVLFGIGLIGVLLLGTGKRKKTFNSFVPLLLQSLNWRIFWLFLKIGSILYGSGYVLFAFLDTELVKKGLLSKQQLVDAIVVGQFTPGPVFSSATFIGWQIGGPAGAVAATIGIFLPSFMFVALLNPLIPRLRRSPTMSAFLDTVNMASIALIAVICIEMGGASVTNWRSIVIAVIGFIISVRFKTLNSAFIVLGGALLGYCLWGI